MNLMKKINSNVYKSKNYKQDLFSIDKRLSMPLEFSLPQFISRSHLKNNNNPSKIQINDNKIEI